MVDLELGLKSFDLVNVLPKKLPVIAVRTTAGVKRGDNRGLK